MTLYIDMQPSINCKRCESHQQPVSHLFGRHDVHQPLVWRSQAEVGAPALRRLAADWLYLQHSCAAGVGWLAGLLQRMLADKPVQTWQTSHRAMDFRLKANTQKLREFIGCISMHILQYINKLFTVIDNSRYALQYDESYRVAAVCNWRVFYRPWAASSSPRLWRSVSWWSRTCARTRTSPVVDTVRHGSAIQHRQYITNTQHVTALCRPRRKGTDSAIYY